MGTKATRLISKTTWTWLDIQNELSTLGNLKGIELDPRSQKPPISPRPYFMAGKWKEITFTFSWVRGKFICLSMSKYSKKLVDAFSAISGKKPFCSYIALGINMQTYEWSWVDEEERFRELKNQSLGIRELKRLKSTKKRR